MYERPAEALAHILADRGCYDIVVHRRVRSKKLKKRGLQELALRLLVWDEFIELGRCTGGKEICRHEMHGKVYTLRTVGDTCTCYARLSYQGGEGLAVESRISSSDVLNLLKSEPLVVLDFTYWNVHTEGERRRLMVQTQLALDAVRDYLWDGNLVLTSCSKEVRGALIPRLGRNKLQVLAEDPASIACSARKAIVLDPLSENDMTENDIRTADVFVLAADVDREKPRPGTSKRLAARLGLETRRIALRGSAVGVPHRINKIIRILLAVRYDGVNLEEAILRNMSKYDKRWRAAYEIRRMVLEQGMDPREACIIARRMLGLDEISARKALKMSGVTRC